MIRTSPIKDLSGIKKWLEPWIKAPPTTPQTIASAQFDAPLVNQIFILLCPDKEISDQKIELKDIHVNFLELDGKLKKCDLKAITTHALLGENPESITFTFITGVNGDLGCVVNTALGEWDWAPMSTYDYPISINNINAHFQPVFSAPVPDSFFSQTDASISIVNMSFSGTPAIGSWEPTPEDIEFTISVPSSGGTWAMLLNSEKGLSIKKEELQTIFHGHDIITGLLVDYFHIDHLQFKRLYLTFNPKEKDNTNPSKTHLVCYQIQTSLAYLVEWKPFDDDRFEIHEIDFNFSLFNPFPGPTNVLQALIAGKMFIDETKIDIEALFNRDLSKKTTSVSLYASISNLDIEVNKVFKFFDFTLPGWLASANIPISQLNFSLFPQDKKGDVSLKLGENLSIFGNIQLQNFYFELHADFKEEKTQVEGTLMASFLLGETSLSLQGSYESTGVWSISSRFGGLHAGTIVTDIAEKFGIDPDAIPSVIKKIELKVLETSYQHDTNQSVFEFSLEGTTELAGIGLDFAPKIKLTHNEETKELDKEFEGSLALRDGEATYTFNITINKDNDNSIIAYYEDNTGALSLQTLCSIFGFTLPSALNAEFNSVDFTYHYEEGNKRLSLNAKSEKYEVYLYTFQKEQKWIRVFGMNLNLSIDLSSLPLIGHTINERVEDLKINLVYASEFLLKEETADIPTNIDIPNSSNGLVKGLSFLADITFKDPDKVVEISSNLTPESNVGTVDDKPISPDASTTGQKSVGKSIGPVHIERVSMNFKGGRLTFNLNVSLVLGPISLSLEGLTISSPIDKVEPSFGLEGLGINYSNKEVQIGGAFLRTPPKGDIPEEYNGLINVGIKQLELVAMGSYAKVDDKPSFFIYGLLNYPIGGPSFFFVTGLAAAIGFNRDLLLPPLDQVSSFPLVAEALKPLPVNPVAPSVTSTNEMVSKMVNNIPITQGAYFFGLGVKFTSFKIIDSFVLLAIKLNKEIEIDVMGLSRYVAPSPYDPKPVAVVELEILGQVLPEQGYAMIQGQLTPASYIFSKNCHLSGGFAFAAWTLDEHAGEFIYSYGGFGNAITESYYPQNIPELGIQWKINDQIAVKGGAYWALTPQFITAGGFMHATFNTSNLKAWFDLDASFIIYWKPFHYEASFYVDIGLSVKIDLLFVHKWLSIDVSADMAISGPPFAGSASIHLSIISVHINFGASTTQPSPIGWAEFSSSFLPDKTEEILQLNVINGLSSTFIQKDENDSNIEWAIINAKDFEIQAQSVIPSNDCSVYYQLTGSKDKIDVSGNKTAQDTGIAPMDIKLGDYEAPLELTITPLESQSEHQVTAKILNENSPAAIWGDGLEAIKGEKKLIHGARKGIVLKAKKANEQDAISIDRSILAWEWETFENVFNWNSLNHEFKVKKKSVEIPYGKPELDANSRRDSILKAMNISISELTTKDIEFDQEIVLGNYN